jgi:hypothetical protein
MLTETGISLPFVNATVGTAGYNSLTNTSAFRLMDYWFPAFLFLKCHSKMVKSDLVSRFSASFLTVTAPMLTQFIGHGLRHWAPLLSSGGAQTWEMERRLIGGPH